MVAHLHDESRVTHVKLLFYPTDPVVHLAIASQDNKILQAVRQGFKNVFGHTAAKGHNGQHSLAKLPIGFEAGIKAAAEQIDSISTIDFRFSQPYIHVAFQPFLTELQGR